MMCRCPSPWCFKVCVGFNEMENENLVLLFQLPNVGGTVGNRAVWTVGSCQVIIFPLEF